MRARGLVTAGLVVSVVMAAAPALAGDPSPPARAAKTRHHHAPAEPENTSDNQPGWIAPKVPGGFARMQVTRDLVKRWRVVPGVRYEAWRQTDARGPIRAHLLRVNPHARGLRLDYVAAGAVGDVASVGAMANRDKAVAAVNGDFYDIGRTGAPLGLGRSLRSGLLHGRAFSPSAGFTLDSRGRPAIGDLSLGIRVVGHPELSVTSLNSPYVLPGEIGLYTKRWARRSGYVMTQGQHSHVRAVWIENGRVRRNVPTLLPHRRITGRLLVGRGAGADQLKVLKRGMRVDTRSWLTGAPRMAITGNKLLVVDGVVKAVDDREMHPRTAVGIDRDTGQVLLLVVDGRSKASRGYTMVELARMMVALGAEDALNLDGGGSSTMVSIGSGKRRVVNTPSDGFQRHVANGLELTYRKPRR